MVVMQTVSLKQDGLALEHPQSVLLFVWMELLFKVKFVMMEMVSIQMDV